MSFKQIHETEMISTYGILGRPMVERVENFDEIIALESKIAQQSAALNRAGEALMIGRLKGIQLEGGDSDEQLAAFRRITAFPLSDPFSFNINPFEMSPEPKRGYIHTYAGCDIPVMRQSDEEFWRQMLIRTCMSASFDDTPARVMVLRKMKKPIPHRSGSGRKNARRVKWLIGATRKVPA